MNDTWFYHGGGGMHSFVTPQKFIAAKDNTFLIPLDAKNIAAEVSEILS